MHLQLMADAFVFIKALCFARCRHVLTAVGARSGKMSLDGISVPEVTVVSLTLSPHSPCTNRLEPSLTNLQNDLVSFHLRAYGHQPPASALPSFFKTFDDPTTSVGCVPEDIDHQIEPYTSYDGLEDDWLEVDGLGHYPDGVKRTLTDDQIAMFRHSEVYTIVRAREREREKAEQEAEEATGTPSSPLDGEHVASTFGLETTVQETLDDTQREENDLINLPSASLLIPRQVRTKDKKRKRSDDQDRPRPPEQTERVRRAVVRELDIVSADEQPLDYGDGATDPPPHAHKVQNIISARQFEAEDGQGSKIWCPIISG